ncbi:MAG: L,D-transpeptidase family protein [Coxiellaceae bacterium]|nr:L,D-transpeptidase family protein [Coxiellaceae bacterium]
MKTLLARIALITLTTLIFNPILAGVFPLPKNGDVVGQVFLVHSARGDTLHSIAKRYDIGWLKMRDANRRLLYKRLRPGTEVVIPSRFILPKQRRGIVVNLAELRLYYFPKGQNVVYTYPVGVGRSKWRTPTLETIVYRKKELPTWYIPESIREETMRKKGKFLPKKIGPGEKNPLGPYAMYLLKRGYLIHGNNAPNSIGTYASSGCIRLFNHDVEQLFHMVPNRTPVHIVHHANKVGWRGNSLYLEVHRPMAHKEDPTDLNHTDVQNEIAIKTANTRAHVNWRKVALVERQRQGIPTRIGSLH